MSELGAGVGLGVSCVNTLRPQVVWSPETNVAWGPELRLHAIMHAGRPEEACMYQVHQILRLVCSVYLCAVSLSMCSGSGDAIVAMIVQLC